MIRNTILSILFFLIILSIPYVLDAGIMLEPKYQSEPSWVKENQEIGEFYVAQDGLYCANQIYQVNLNGLYIPSRRCRMPDQSWQLVPF